MSPPKGLGELTERSKLLEKSSQGSLRHEHPVVAPHDEDSESGVIAGDEAPLVDGHPEVVAKLKWLFPAVSLGVMLGSADQTLVVTTYGRIGSDLKALKYASWIVTAYFLTLTSFQPLYGKLSDIFGRKPTLLFAYTTFGLGCLACGLARNLGELVAARAISGVGGGGMTTVVSILLSDVIPVRQRGTWQGYMTLVYQVGASAGAPIGGLLSDSIGWRWAFLGQVPLCLIAIVVVYLVLDLPPTKEQDSNWKAKLKKVDFLGSFSLIIAVSTLLYGLHTGSNVGWSDKLTIICCCLSVPLFAIFIGIETKVSSNPLAPGHIIFSRKVYPSYMCNFFCLAGHMATLFYVPFYLQVVDHLSTTYSGLWLTPPLIASVIGSISSGHIMQRTGKYYWLTIICLFTSILGSIIICLSASILNYSWGLIIGLCLVTFGTSCTITTTLISIISNVCPEDQATATACTYLFRSLGSVIGVSLGSTALQQQLRTRLMSQLENGGNVDKLIENVRQSLDYIGKLNPKTRLVVIGCYQQAITVTFAVTAGLTSLAFLSSFFIIRKKING